MHDRSKGAVLGATNAVAILMASGAFGQVKPDLAPRSIVLCCVALVGAGLGAMVGSMSEPTWSFRVRALAYVFVGSLCLLLVAPAYVDALPCGVPFTMAHALGLARWTHQPRMPRAIVERTR